MDTVDCAGVHHTHQLEQGGEDEHQVNAVMLRNEAHEVSLVEGLLLEVDDVEAHFAILKDQHRPHCEDLSTQT